MKFVSLRALEIAAEARWRTPFIWRRRRATQV